MNINPNKDNPATNGKVPLSHMMIGNMAGGNVSRMLLRTKGQTLTEHVNSLHGWVKKPKGKEK